MQTAATCAGFSVELAAAIIVIVSSRYGLPVSTTHCLVGAVTGIGLVETFLGSRTKGTRTFNFKILLKFFAGWLATLVVAALTAAAFTAQGVYAPGKYNRDQMNQCTAYVNSTAVAVASTLNSTEQSAVLALTKKVPINFVSTIEPALDQALAFANASCSA